MRRHVLIVVLGIMAASCGSSPTSPSTSSTTTTTTPTPNFQGVWSGNWSRSTCSETGSAVGQFCSGLTGGTLKLTLTQSGTAAQGTLLLGSIQYSVSGPIGSTGTLTLTGSASALGGTQSLSAWQSQISGTSLNGTFTYIILSPGGSAAGSATVTGSLQGVIKTG